MRARFLSALVASSLLLFACDVAVAYIPLNAPPRSMTARPKEEVEIFANKRPERPFVEVASIEVQQEDYNNATPAQLTNKMREVAGKRGCDALILDGANDGSTVLGGASNGSGVVSGRSLKGYRATCIVYADPAVPPAVAGAHDTPL